MIEFKRDDTKVVMNVQTGIASEKPVMRWVWETNSEWFADLLAAQLRDRLWNILKGIRQEFYEKGYRDGRARRAKETCFRGGL